MSNIVRGSIGSYIVVGLACAVFGSLFTTQLAAKKSQGDVKPVVTVVEPPQPIVDALNAPVTPEERPTEPASNVAQVLAINELTKAFVGLEQRLETLEVIQVETARGQTEHGMQKVDQAIDDLLGQIEDMPEGDGGVTGESAGAAESDPVKAD